MGALWAFKRQHLGSLSGLTEPGKRGQWQLLNRIQERGRREKNKERRHEKIGFAKTRKTEKRSVGRKSEEEEQSFFFFLQITNEVTKKDKCIDRKGKERALNYMAGGK